MTPVYLDHAACGWPRPQEVVDAVADAMARAGNAGRGTTGPSRAADEIVAAARKEICEWMNAPRVAFFLNATDALNQAIHGTLRSGRVLTTVWEHNSLLRPLMHAEAEGRCEIHRLLIDDAYHIDLDCLERGLAEGDVQLVAVHHASNVLGVVQDIPAIARLCRSHGVPLLVDASQSAGIIDIDVAGWGVDMLAFSGHKALYGPTGVGVLCLREGVRLRPMRQGGTGGYLSDLPMQPEGVLEAGTLNAVGIAGVLAAVRWLRGIGGVRVRQHLFGLTRRLIASLVVHPNVTVYHAEPEVGIVTFNLDGWEPMEVARVLDESYGVGVAAGLMCAPETHVALGTLPTGALRASLGIRSRESDVDALSDAIEKMAAATIYNGE